MKVLVLGASRGVGLLVAQQALALGHDVTAVARTLPPIGGSFPRLSLKKASIEDRFAMQCLVPGHDAVVICIGALPGFEPVRCFSAGTAHVIEAMQIAEMKRLIVVTGVGAGDSKGHGGWLYDRLFQPLVMGTLYKDKNRQEQQVMGSTLDWTIVRPGFLTHGPLTEAYQAMTDLQGITASKISRADVAHFIVGQLANNQWLYKTPLVIG